MSSGKQRLFQNIASGIVKAVSKIRQVNVAHLSGDLKQTPATCCHFKAKSENYLQKQCLVVSDLKTCYPFHYKWRLFLDLNCFYLISLKIISSQSFFSCFHFNLFFFPLAICLPITLTNSILLRDRQYIFLPQNSPFFVSPTEFYLPEFHPFINTYTEY